MRTEFLFASLLSLLIAPPAIAQTEDWYPVGAYNGYRIFLSPATHSGSGGGGCLNGNPAAYENNMAQLNARDAAAGFTDGSPYSQYSDLSERGYWIRIGFGSNQEKINASNEFAATVHLPIHSNGRTVLECASTDASRFGSWGIYNSKAAYAEINLAEWLVYWVGSGSPGSADRTCADNVCTNYDQLGELVYTTAPRRAYLEQEYHSWDRGANWLLNDLTWQWRISASVDDHLGNPR